MKLEGQKWVWLPRPEGEWHERCCCLSEAAKGGDETASEDDRCRRRGGLLSWTDSEDEKVEGQGRWLLKLVDAGGQESWRRMDHHDAAIRDRSHSKRSHQLERLHPGPERSQPTTTRRLFP